MGSNRYFQVLRMAALFALLPALPAAAGNAVKSAPISTPPALARPLVAAHRGGLSDNPENTLAAFAWAGQVGADLIELDLRVTRDRQIVVMHDERVNRTTNGKGLVRRFTLAELKKLDAGSGERVPTIGETLAFAADTGQHLLLDLKDEDRLDVVALLALVSQHDASGLVTYGVRSTRQLATVEGTDRTLHTLAFSDSTDSILDYLAGGADAIRLWPEWLEDQPGLAAAIRSRGAEIWVTTGRLGGSALESLTRFGVDGFITDLPRAALSLRPAERHDSGRY